MSDQFFALIGQARCTKFVLVIPQKGPWYVDAILDDVDASVTGRVTITLGSLRLVGTVVTGYSGNFVLQRSVRVVGGAGGWGTFLSPKTYHHDAGLWHETIARDAATECGETLGSVDFGSSQLGVDYLRRLGPGSAVLERLLEDSGGTWWVDESGVTNCGQRPTMAPEQGSYSTLSYSPLQRLLKLQCQDPAALWVGSIITDRLNVPQTIRELEIELTAGAMTVTAWVGGDSEDSANINKLLDAYIDQHLARRLLGKWKYRVYSMDGHRANCQAVQTGSSTGLASDALPVTLALGLPGCHADLSPGSIVWIEFGQGGDPTFPLLVGFGDVDDDKHFVPTRLTLGSDGDAPNAARQGDTVASVLAPATFVGQIVVGGVPSPATGMIIWSSPTIEGVIDSGSNLVGIGP